MRVFAAIHKALLVAVAALASIAWAQAADPLPSWNETTGKRAVVAFVEKVTTPGSPDLVPPAERIAVFDNDGTLWSEQPMYVQLAFALDRVKALAPQHPEWKDRQPFKAALEGDMKALSESGEHGLLELLVATHAGNTMEEFAAIVEGLARDGPAPEDRTALYRDGLPADAGAARLPAGQRLQDLHRLGWGHRVHAPLGRACLRRAAGAGHRQQHQDQVRSPRRQAGAVAPAGARTSSTTRRASRSASTSTSVGGRSLPSATPMATSKCSSGRLPAPARASA